MYDYIVEDEWTGNDVSVWQGGQPYVGMCILDDCGAMWKVVDYCFLDQDTVFILVEYDFDY